MGDQLSTLEKSRRDFVANVSHELRSPITSIQGFAQGMLDGTIPEEQHPQYLQVVVDETHRLAKLIHHLLDLVRVGVNIAGVRFKLHGHFQLRKVPAKSARLRFVQ